MRGVLIFLFECTKRRSQSHVVFWYFGSKIWQQNRKQGLSCYRVSVKCLTDIPLPKHGNSSRCEHQAVAKRRFGGDLATIAKECLSIGMDVETEPAPLGLEFVTFFLKKKRQVFSSSSTHPFFLLGQWEMRQPLRRRFVDIKLPICRRLPCRRPWQLSKLSCKVETILCRHLRLRLKLKQKLKPRQRVPGNEDGPMYLWFIIFFRGYPKSMEWNFLKLNDFFAHFFQSI